MSPISSDSVDLEVPAARRAAATAQRLRERRQQRRFERSFWILVASLVVVAAVFLLLGSLQGPKLSSAVVDPARVVEQPGQQLRLFANQPLRDVSVNQVTVTPAVEISVAVEGEVLIVQFESRLRSGTEYLVDVQDVAAMSRDATADFAHRFTTPGASVVYIDRGETRDDVLRAPIDGAGRGEVVHVASGIQHVAPVEQVIVVARDAPRGTSVLEVVSEEGVVQQVALPSGVRVDRLVVPPIGALVGLVLTTVSGEVDDADVLLDRTLAVVDLAADTPVEIVTSLDGAPISARDAEFLPDGASLIVHTLEQTLVRVDVGEPTVSLPVGQMPEMYALSTDGTRVTGADAFGGIALELATAIESRLDPSLLDGELVFGGEAILTDSELRVQKVGILNDATGAVRVLLVADDGSGASRTLFRTIDDRGSIGAFSVSPNNQFVAVEVTPSVTDAVADARPVNGRPTSITTMIIDIESGALVRALEGFAPQW